MHLENLYAHNVITIVRNGYAHYVIVTVLFKFDMECSTELLNMLKKLPAIMRSSHEFSFFNRFRVRNAQVAVCLLWACCCLEDIKRYQNELASLASGLMVTSLLNVVSRLDASFTHKLNASCFDNFQEAYKFQGTSSLIVRLQP